ncbi:MAG: hypothetical protein HY372_01985 [Candidatus Andersenbacteria bacterium]|nr:hypothetical protein [Candidatus Andersenbacteria bacterium]
MNAGSNNNRSPYLIAITGTKGKTSLARLLSYLFTTAGEYTLRVDTDGHFVNDQPHSTSKDSRRLYGLLPATSPGRYLYELRGHDNAVAVLEVSISSGGTAGLGYLWHHIGVLTNVYEDHIGRSISTPAQLAALKAKLIFSRIKPGGTAVFNADDRRVVRNLPQVPAKLGVTLLPVGLTFQNFGLDHHLAAGGRAVTRQGDMIGLLTRRGFNPHLNVAAIPWTFGGFYEPSVYTLMLAYAVLSARAGSSAPLAYLAAIQKYRLPETGGRLIKLSNTSSGVTVILDLAHEAHSLQHVARLAAKLARGKTIGIIRLNPDRTDALIIATGRRLANAFDVVIVYDKLDNIRRRKFVVKRWPLVRRSGEVATLLSHSIRQHQKNPHRVYKVIAEEKAIQKASRIAKPGDVIVHIVNDDHAQSLAYAKQYLTAV